MPNLENVSLEACLNNPELKCVPKDMGEVTYCYFDKKRVMNKTVSTILAIFMVFGAIAASRGGLGGALIFGALVCLLVLIGKITGFYQYEEAYICTDGFAWYTYRYNKYFQQANCDEEIAHKFSEIDYLRKNKTLDIVGEGDDERTITEDTFEFHLKKGNVIRYTVTKDEEYVRIRVFLEKVERAWNKLAFNKLIANRQEGTPLPFDYSNGNEIKKGYILVDEAGVHVDIENYQGLNATAMNFNENNIRICFKDLPTISVQKYRIHNIGVFCMALNHFHNTDVYYSFEGIVKFE